MATGFFPFSVFPQGKEHTMDYPNTLPPAVAHCCRTLWQAGFEAYPVGGCVRDLQIGRASV